MDRTFRKALAEAHQYHSMLPDLVVTAKEPGRWTVTSIAPWFAAWSQDSAAALIDRPFAEAVGNAYDALLPVVEAVHDTGASVRDYCIEFDDAAGRHRGILVLAERVDDVDGTGAAAGSGGDDTAIFLRFHDVSDALHIQRSVVETSSFEGMIARSKPMAAVFRKIELYGPVEMPVVITGETGTGKELASSALHRRSPRHDGPFVAFNCTAVSADLLESELFGHERGAFTGAISSHKGLFEQADKGTLFLDEIGEMPLTTQAKLLRVLEDGRVSRVGAEKTRRVDVRVVAATNVPLELAVGLKQFRADLYHRLSVLRIHLPPLRERREDIPLLVDHFLAELNARYGKRNLRLTQEALEIVIGYVWPGNVRELRNALNRVYVESQGPVIGRGAFDEWMRERQAMAPSQWKLDAARGLAGIHAPADPLLLPPPPVPTEPHGAPSIREGTGGGQRPKEVTEAAIRTAFREAEGNATQAARKLGVHKATLYRRMKALGIAREDL